MRQSFGSRIRHRNESILKMAIVKMLGWLFCIIFQSLKILMLTRYKCIYRVCFSPRRNILAPTQFDGRIFSECLVTLKLNEAFIKQPALYWNVSVWLRTGRCCVHIKQWCRTFWMHDTNVVTNVTSSRWLWIENKWIQININAAKQIFFTV